MSENNEVVVNHSFIKNAAARIIQDELASSGFSQETVKLVSGLLENITNQEIFDLEDYANKIETALTHVLDKEPDSE